MGSGFGVLYGMYYRASDAEYIQLTHNRPRTARLLRSVHIIPETVKEKVASNVRFDVVQQVRLQSVHRSSCSCHPLSEVEFLPFFHVVA